MRDANFRVFAKTIVRVLYLQAPKGSARVSTIQDVSSTPITY